MIKSLIHWAVHNRLVVVLLALALVGTARAEDTKTTESKSTVKQKDDGTGSVKVEKKSTNDPSGAANSTTDKSTYDKDVSKNSMGGKTTKVEKKATHDAPGMKGDSKTDVKEVTAAIEKILPTLKG